LLENFKQYIFLFSDSKLNPDLKILLGSLILEYLYPLMTEDKYLMEQLVVQFLLDIQNMPGLNSDKFNQIIFNTIEIAYD
jgi:hypothetical protein